MYSVEMLDETGRGSRSDYEGSPFGHVSGRRGRDRLATNDATFRKRSSETTSLAPSLIPSTAFSPNKHPSV